MRRWMWTQRKAINSPEDNYSIHNNYNYGVSKSTFKRWLIFEKKFKYPYRLNFNKNSASVTKNTKPEMVWFKKIDIWIDSCMPEYVKDTGHEDFINITKDGRRLLKWIDFINRTIKEYNPILVVASGIVVYIFAHNFGVSIFQKVIMRVHEWLS